MSTDGGKKWNKAEFKGTPQRMAHTRFGYHVELGRQRDRAPCRAARTNSARFNRRARRSPSTGTSPSIRHSACRGWTTRIQPWRIAQRRERDQWARVEFCRSRSRCSWASPALAQAPTYGVGRTPTARGNPRLGYLHRSDRRGTPAGTRHRQGRRAALSREGMRGMPRRDGHRGHGAHSEKQRWPANPDVWARGRILPLRAPFATTVWDYINRGMPLNQRGDADRRRGLRADGVSALHQRCHPGGPGPRRPESAEGEDADWRRLRAPA